MNARLKRLGFNSIWMSLSRLGAQGLGVAFIVLLGRGLGSAGFGEYAFLAAVLTTGNALTTFGTDMHLIRQIAGEGKLSDKVIAAIRRLSEKPIQSIGQVVSDSIPSELHPSS